MKTKLTFLLKKFPELPVIDIILGLKPSNMKLFLLRYLDIDLYFLILYFCMNLQCKAAPFLIVICKFASVIKPFKPKNISLLIFELIKIF